MSRLSNPGCDPRRSTNRHSLVEYQTLFLKLRVPSFDRMHESFAALSCIDICVEIDERISAQFLYRLCN